MEDQRKSAVSRVNTQDESTRRSETLARRLRDGNRGSLDEILRWLGPSTAYGLGRKYACLNEQDLEDILAIALFRLWQSRERFDPSRASLRTYFFRIADNVARNVFQYGWYKARSRERLIEPEPATRPTQPPAPPREGRAVEDLRRVLDELPDTYRQIVLADAYAKDRVASAKFLADELEIPEGTVRVYRNRAMGVLRRRMRELGHEVDENL